MVRSQFLASGRHIRKLARMLETFQTMVKAPMTRAQRIMERTGIRAVYMSKTDNLLKHTVAFQIMAKAMIP